MMEKIKDLAWMAGILLLVGGAFMEWRISVAVDAALASEDIATDAKIISMDAGIADNKRTGEYHAELITATDQRLRDVANILMEQ